MFVQSYLDFDGRCEEALKFYQKALGAKLGTVLRFKDHEEACKAHPGNEEKIMHSEFTIGDSLLMATDGYNKGQPKFDGVSLSISTASDAETKKVFDALADGGKALMPLAKTFFASSFGMLTDKFGVSWMVITNSKK